MIDNNSFWIRANCSRNCDWLAMNCAWFAIRVACVLMSDTNASSNRPFLSLGVVFPGMIVFYRLAAEPATPKRAERAEPVMADVLFHPEDWDKTVNLGGFLGNPIPTAPTEVIYFEWRHYWHQNCPLEPQFRIRLESEGLSCCSTIQPSNRLTDKPRAGDPLESEDVHMIPKLAFVGFSLCLCALEAGADGITPFSTAEVEGCVGPQTSGSCSEEVFDSGSPGASINTTLPAGTGTATMSGDYQSEYGILRSSSSESFSGSSTPISAVVLGESAFLDIITIGFPRLPAARDTCLSASIWTVPTLKAAHCTRWPA